MNTEVILCTGSLMNVSSSVRKSNLSFCEDVIQDGFDLASTISPAESRHDSIVELYCDDEFRMGLELDNSHLGLSSCEDLSSLIGSVEDIIEEDREEAFLPYSVPSVMLRESFKEIKKLNTRLEDIGEEYSILSQLIGHIVVKCEDATKKIENLEWKS